MHEKLTKCPNFTWYLPEKLTKFPNFTWYMPEKINKMPEFYTIFARKNSFCPNLGGGTTAPLPPVSYAYEPSYEEMHSWRYYCSYGAWPIKAERPVFCVLIFLPQELSENRLQWLSGVCCCCLSHWHSASSDQPRTTSKSSSVPSSTYSPVSNNSDRITAFTTWSAYCLYCPTAGRDAELNGSVGSTPSSYNVNV